MPEFDFAGVSDQVTYQPIPAGKYELTLTDYREGAVKNESSENYGATKYDFTFEVTGPGTVDEKYMGKKVFDNVTITPKSMWRLKALLKAFGVDVPDEGAFRIEFDDLLGEVIEANVKVNPARKVGDAEYDAKNAIKSFIIPDLEESASK
jgi:hypothetical protein